METFAIIKFIILVAFKIYNKFVWILGVQTDDPNRTNKQYSITMSAFSFREKQDLIYFS